MSDEQRDKLKAMALHISAACWGTTPWQSVEVYRQNILDMANDYSQLLVALSAAEAERDAALALLSHLEWRGYAGRCPCCQGKEHDPDCKLAEMLARHAPGDSD
jgi:hypothetical protein